MGKSGKPSQTKFGRGKTKQGQPKGSRSTRKALHEKPPTIYSQQQIDPRDQWLSFRLYQEVDKAIYVWVQKRKRMEEEVGRGKFAAGVDEADGGDRDVVGGQGVDPDGGGLAGIVEDAAGRDV